jgi:transcription-repair coupling factor (superfamily II helicase)
VNEPIHITGTTASVRGILVARYSRLVHQDRKKTSPVLLICPSTDLIPEYCSDLECLASVVDQFEIQVLPFFTWDQSPYSPIQPSLLTQMSRLSCLNRLVQKDFPDVIITTIPALCQRTIPPRALLENTMRISVGQNIESREALALKLTEAGYFRVDPVEDAGTFSVRGEIIDIYPIDRDRPIRVELFDDEIEKIREFDPASQRTLPDSQSLPKEILIPPAKEVLINTQSAALLRERRVSIPITRTLGLPLPIGKRPLFGTISLKTHKWFGVTSSDACRNGTPFLLNKKSFLRGLLILA